MKKFASLILILALILSLAACGGSSNGSASTTGSPTPAGSAAGGAPAQAPSAASDAPTGDVPVVKMAALHNFSGGGAAVGEYMRKALDLEVQRVNANGGVKSLGGAMIEIVYGDMMTDTTQVKAIAERILADPEILCCLGMDGSAYTAAGLPSAERLNVPVLAGYATSNTQQGYQNIFHARGNTGQVAPLQLEFLNHVAETTGRDTKKVAIMYIDNEYGLTTGEGYKGVLELDSSYELVYESAFPANITDASSLITALKSSGAEALFLTCELASGKAIFAAMKALDCNPIVLGGGSGMVQKSFADELGDSVIGIVSTSCTAYNSKNILDDPEMADFIQDYFETYNEFPNENGIDSYAYLHIVLESLERTGSRDRDVLREDLRNNTFSSYTIPAKEGKADFDETGLNTYGQLVLVQWQKDPQTGWISPACIFPRDMAGVEISYNLGTEG